MTPSWTTRTQALSEDGLAALKHEEGLRLEAYQDVAGVWTVGYGHTGPDVHRGVVWTQAQADAALAADVAWAVSAVQTKVRVALHQHEFDALVSFVYNVGAAAFASSTLLRVLNQADFYAAAAQFSVWHQAGGKFSPGLLARRTRELLRFCGYLSGREHT